MSYRVENMMRQGDIACYRQFLLFSHCFPQLYTGACIFHASKCSIVWYWINGFSIKLLYLNGLISVNNGIYLGGFE